MGRSDSRLSDTQVELVISCALTAGFFVLYSQESGFSHPAAVPACHPTVAHHSLIRKAQTSSTTRDSFHCQTMTSPSGPELICCALHCLPLTIL